MALLFLQVVYALTALLLSGYALNALVTIWLYWCHRHDAFPRPPLVRTPNVTVQLPTYNEMYVVARLVKSITRLEYPRDKLQIQILDDSNDETTAIARKLVERYQAQGFDIELIHRSTRQGFKGGALREGLKRATGEYIAIFDADFAPNSDFLLKTIPYFLQDSQLGLIQTRWGHLNSGYSAFTRAQAIALDGHFAIEQTARHRAGLLMNFNGSGGVWRKACILDAGNWQDDTVCEDLDLSYRAQLAGWRFLFLSDVISPAEIPPQVHALKRQQFRWAKGSIQCTLKLWKQVVAAPLPLFNRLQGLIHLSNYLVHPLMLILMILAVPLMHWHTSFLSPLIFLSLASLGQPILYALSQWDLYPNWQRRLTFLPLLTFLGIGISLSTTCAIREAITNTRNDFQRTPKFRIEKRTDTWTDKKYTLPPDWLIRGEILLTLYSVCGVVFALLNHNYIAVPLFLLYVIGFSYVVCLTVLHARRN
jgi:cellulose synthase/poly-beta-1,6-N-acetylglucosamine synthase-like glycosyltransferase